MRDTIKKPLLFVTALLPVTIVGGLFTGIYSFDTYTLEMQNQMIAQVGSYEILLLVGTLQSVIYAAVCGFIGYILSAKIGLMGELYLKKRKTDKSPSCYSYLRNFI